MWPQENCNLVVKMIKTVAEANTFDIYHTSIKQWVRCILDIYLEINQTQYDSIQLQLQLN